MDFGAADHKSKRAQDCSIDWKDLMRFCRRYRTIEGQRLEHIRLATCFNFDDDRYGQLAKVAGSVAWYGEESDWIGVAGSDSEDD